MLESEPPTAQATGIGSIGIECSGIPGDAAACDMACRIANLRAFQLGALGQTRLGIPVTFVIETSHSGAAGGVIFPMGASQGASWNVSLAGEVARIIAAEGRAWGGSRGLSPEINVVTDPRFGRTEENYGADALLVSKMAAAAVQGLQGGPEGPTEYLTDPNASLVAEAKHCCVYGYQGLDGGAADVSPKTLHDIYLKPWRAYIAAGGRGMMMSHNEVNGVSMHANSEVMTDLFRGAWNYSGFFHSDYQNIAALVAAHVAGSVTDAAALAIAAGVDQAFLDAAYSAGVLLPALASGAISTADVDRAAGAVLAAKFAAGLFDGQLPEPGAAATIATPAHLAAARAAAAEGTVLLRNVNGTLPLDVASLRRVAVIGPNSGCAGAAGAPVGCAFEPGVDCDGGDLVAVPNVTDAAACCALCNANASCMCVSAGNGAMGVSSSLVGTACLGILFVLASPTLPSQGRGARD